MGKLWEFYGTSINQKKNCPDPVWKPVIEESTRICLSRCKTFKIKNNRCLTEQYFNKKNNINNSSINDITKNILSITLRIY